MSKKFKVGDLVKYTDSRGEVKHVICTREAYKSYSHSESVPCISALFPNGHVFSVPLDQVEVVSVPLEQSEYAGR